MGRSFAEWTARQGIGAAGAVTIEVAELFVRHLRHELRLQDRTVNDEVTAVGSMFAWG